MKRRAVLVRSAVTGISAVIFSATGFLMGTRALTMPPPTPPPGGGTTGTHTGQEYFPDYYCLNSCGCNKLCAREVLCPPNPPNERCWYGCTCEDLPCSYGFCRFTENCLPWTC
jgi:hypothetical protein